MVDLDIAVRIDQVRLLHDIGDSGKVLAGIVCVGIPRHIEALCRQSAQKPGVAAQEKRLLPVYTSALFFFQDPAHKSRGLQHFHRAVDLRYDLRCVPDVFLIRKTFLIIKMVKIVLIYKINSSQHKCYYNDVNIKV